MDNQPQGWIQPAKQAFIRPPAMPASQLLNKAGPAHQSAKQTADAIWKEKKVKFGRQGLLLGQCQGSPNSAPSLSQQLSSGSNTATIVEVEGRDWSRLQLMQ